MLDLDQVTYSNGSLLKDLKCSHSDYGTSDESRIVIFRHYLPVQRVGNLHACCLPWMWHPFLRLPNVRLVSCLGLPMICLTPFTILLGSVLCFSSLVR